MWAPWLSALCVSLPQAAGGPAPEPTRPNIVLVVADDADNEHYGFMGHPGAHTPNLDELARAGFLFPAAYVTPRCRTTLAELLTGRWPHQSGIFFNDNDAILDTPEALPRLLRAAGYATFCGGKFWEGDIHAMGFAAPAVLDGNFVRSGQQPLFEFLAALGDEPFFVWWAPALPHFPHDAQKKHQKLVAEKEFPAPAWGTGNLQHLVRKERQFLATGAWFDAELGLLQKRLAELGKLENTLFVFLIDNGWSIGLVSKGSPYEKGVRSPLVLHWPGRIVPGRGDALVDVVDVYPTLLDLAGIPVPAGCAGRSLRPWLEGGRGEAREWLCGAAYPASVTKGAAEEAYALYVRDRRWKYVLYLREASEDSPFRIHAPSTAFARAAGTQELYDLDADPYERADLSGDAAQAERLETMRAAVLEWWRTSGGPELTLPPLATR